MSEKAKSFYLITQYSTLITSFVARHLSPVAALCYLQTTLQHKDNQHG
jgi:hypothetical protein